MKYIFWHKNPDTDAYCAAVVYARYLHDRWQKVQAIALGEPNNETHYVFSRAWIQLPSVMPRLPEGAEIVLVDHNELGQSIDARELYTIVWVIDHHKIADFHTPAPIFMRVDAVGCTCTILHELFTEQGYTPSASMAWLMLSAIISDTLYFRSPTTTDRDRAALAALSVLAWCTDPEAYSLEMFAAKSDLGNMPIEKIVLLDYKEFTFGEKKVGIGVMETTNPAYAMGRKHELLAALREKKQEEGLDHLLFCVVDILAEKNTAFVTDEADAAWITEIFEVSIADHQAMLGNILSRKKQLVPMIEAYYG